MKDTGSGSKTAVWETGRTQFIWAYFRLNCPLTGPDLSRSVINARYDEMFSRRIDTGGEKWVSSGLYEAKKEMVNF